MAAKSDGAPVSQRDEVPPECRPDRRAPQFHPGGKPYSPLDCCWTLCALLVCFSDGASDLWLAADYYLRQKYHWFALTLVFVVVPSFVVQVLSFRWFFYDYSDAAESGTAVAAVVAASGGAESNFSTKDSAKRGAGHAAAAAGGSPAPVTGGAARGCCRACIWLFQSIIHIFQLAQVWRSVHVLYLGVQSRWHGDHERSHFHWRLMFASADISMLRLLEAFLRSAPQLVLQLSIMIHTGQVLPLQGLSASASLVSLSWMIASYQKVLRDSRDDKLPMSYKAVIVQILWHLFSLAARAAALALFASVFQLYFGIFMVTHWCVMTFWIIQGETDFCMSKWEEIVYNMMVGVVYVFCWFSVRAGPTRWRLLVYSVTVLVENAALTAAWYLHRGQRTSDFHALVLVCAVASSYALGTFFMFVYYCLLHPDGPASGWGLGGAEEGAESLASPTSTLPPTDGAVVSSPPRTLQRTKGGEREGAGGVDGDVFQVRPLRAGPGSAPRPQAPRGPEGPVIRIDLPRKRYPAWDAHFVDRRLRRTILVLDGAAPVPPVIQYRSLDSPKELTEYETTV